jgi:hypothetical protein
MIEESVDDEFECHGCGEMYSEGVSIRILNLCQHYLNLCSSCFKEFKKALNDYEVKQF